MKFLEGKDKETALFYLKECEKIALEKASCLRSLCGSVIVNKNKIIGKGWNSLPLDKKPSFCWKDSLPEDFKSDKTCCIHAEQRALIDALKNYPNEVIGSTIYFVRLDKNKKRMPSGKPYCTVCSKLCLEAGVKYWVLEHKEGIVIYDSDEYNQISFGLKKRVLEDNK